MPYPNEHSARIRNPDDFNKESFRRNNDGTIYGKVKVPRTIAVIWAKLKGKDKPSDKPIPQALRFPTKYWTATKAKKWLKDHNIKYEKFEPAGEDKSEASAATSIFALLAQMETQFWAMEARALQGLFAHLSRQQQYLPDEVAVAAARPKLRRQGHRGIIDIHGVLMRQVPRAFSFWGIDSTSYEDIQQQLAEALDDPKISELQLAVNSPGGTVPGVLETAEMIRAARQQKPVHAVIDDIGTSAAYWLASQAQNIAAEPNSTTGSIGVYTVYLDISDMADKSGIKVHVIRSGEHKGMGVPGAPITETQIGGIQEVIDGIADNFVHAVAAGRNRGLKEVRSWASGQQWLAGKAKQLGLIDEIHNVNIATQTQPTQKGYDMDEHDVDTQAELNRAGDEAKAAERQRLADLKVAFPDDLEFALTAFEKGSSVQEAKAEYCDVVVERVKAQQAEEAKAKAQAEQAKTQAQDKQGATPMASDDSDDEASGDFITEARKLAKETGITMTAAMRQLARQRPQLHEAFKDKSRAEGRAIFAQI
jgi:signal peptide peptidase SppA